MATWTKKTLLNLRRPGTPEYALAHNPAVLDDTVLREAERGVALWEESAFSQVRVTECYLALLLATKVPRDVARLARSPWPGFWLDIPRGYLSLEEEGHQYLVDGLLVYEDGNAWCTVGTGTGGFVFARVPYKSAAEGSPSCLDRSTGAVTRSNRYVEALSRILVNVCLAMSDPGVLKETPVGGGSRKRRSDEPLARNYVLGKSTAIDCRSAVRAALRGEGPPPTVQTLVAGHWKPKLGERLGRPVHVEPYWRGPEDAPIKVQQKVLVSPVP